VPCLPRLLASVVSKYIGETEKNLEKVFNMAEDKDWILFFDEADSLFGKRTGIKDSHDRYANQEVSYLLQRIEEYGGLVVLSTNQKINIDDAFARRFQSVIRFPMPDADQRKAIWTRSFSPQTEFEDAISWETVAKDYELTGGAIMNVSPICLRDGDEPGRECHPAPGYPAGCPAGVPEGREDPPVTVRRAKTQNRLTLTSQPVFVHQSSGCCFCRPSLGSLRSCR
jgi:ATPases of the AAA+ class